MGNNTLNKVSVNISKDIIDTIIKITGVNPQYISKTIERMLRDEIELERKIKEVK